MMLIVKRATPLLALLLAGFFLTPAYAAPPPNCVESHANSNTNRLYQWFTLYRSLGYPSSNPEGVGEWTNPTPHVWDHGPQLDGSDDHNMWRHCNRVAEGETLTWTELVLADHVSHAARIRVADQQGRPLPATITIRNAHHQRGFGPDSDGQFCVSTPQYADPIGSPYLTEVPGSGLGGRPNGKAVLTEVIYSATAVGRSYRNVVFETFTGGFWPNDPRQDPECQSLTLSAGDPAYYSR